VRSGERCLNVKEHSSWICAAAAKNKLLVCQRASGVRVYELLEHAMHAVPREAQSCRLEALG
jgi:hypothetical protein